jgi:hypothetical protein
MVDDKTLRIAATEADPGQALAGKKATPAQRRSASAGAGYWLEGADPGWCRP